MKNIVNIVNFVRAIEPRPGRNIDLVEPVRQQIALLKKYNLKGTFLLQYDTLLDNSFVDLVKENTDVAEVGLWFEIVQPLVENVGEEWHGRYPWDWYNDVGFTIGYEPGVRIKLVDEAMSKFKEIFGYFPECVGSWHIDSVSMDYFDSKYNVSACCICRDQVGIDGYTMQGGFFNQAYYPSKNNMFCPANSKENQINMPVFRMLGSDPIYEIDCQLYPEVWKLGQPTLEPVSSKFGGNEEWCKWFFDQNFNGSGISMQYTQVGQENSFGWPRMSKGLDIQFNIVKQLSQQGKVEVMTLAEAGKWYKSNFEITPPATQSALTDVQGLNKKSAWYNSRFYRMNVLFEDGIVRIRDMYIFNDELKEKYLERRCVTHACEFRNLPVMDSLLYTDKDKDETIAGVYFAKQGKAIKWNDMQYREENNSAVVTLESECGKLTLKMNEESVEIDTDVEGFVLKPVYNKDLVYGNVPDRDSFGNHNNRSVIISCVSQADVKENTAYFTFCDINYSLQAVAGTFSDNFELAPKDGKITVKINGKLK